MAQVLCNGPITAGQRAIERSNGSITFTIQKLFPRGFNPPIEQVGIGSNFRRPSPTITHNIMPMLHGHAKHFTRAFEVPLKKTRLTSEWSIVRSMQESYKFVCPCRWC